ncbi:hypothetical protein TI39_contig329g00010 [Zymoseptoria brevis]|uniref:F-box domain-containing protein n=1 Tax=Zymoseptoria brevis TaxID=1047168 RepID=A0A0F4GW49_9PEZI|nr:hypothetical protein TI39_contig329g00010 [Zymoseptoria brevis]
MQTPSSESFTFSQSHAFHASHSSASAATESSPAPPTFLEPLPTPSRSEASGYGGLSTSAGMRRLSRDDTGNDMHVLVAHAIEGPKVGSSGEESMRIQRRARKPLSRLPSNNTTSTSASSAEPKISLSRRLSKQATNAFRDTVQRATHTVSGVSSSRSRRSSTPNRIEFGTGSQPMSVTDVLSRPPTSPSKRSAKQFDDRPRKHRPTFFPLGDRKDTPAPPTFGGSNLPVRPATAKSSALGMISMGGDNARKAAASANMTSPFFTTPAWSNPEQDDIHTRRIRLGSLSSAADSGADLSIYGDSDASIRDLDGDIDMDHGESATPASYDFTKTLPPEIVISIFEYVDAQDLHSAAQVNWKWNAMTKDTQVWRTVFLRRYQRQVLTDPAPIQVGGAGLGRPNRPNQEWRKMYQARLELEKNWRAGAHDAGKAVYLSGHTDSVYCLQFDEEKIITGSRDRTIRVWDINTYQCLRVIGGPNVRPVLGPKVLRTVDYPSFHMATASVNGTAYGNSIYHTPSEWHDASILCLQYDDKILVTGSSDSDLLIWDIKTYQPIRRLRKHTGGVLDVALDAKHIVSCSKDSRIIVWDRETYEPKGELTGHRGPVNAVQLRGHLLVSASGDGIARLWDLNQMKMIKEFSAKERGLAAVEFSEDMKYVLAGGNDNITYKFETDTGREVMQFTGHSQLVRSLWLDSANDRVVSGSYDLDLRVYDFVTGQELWRGEEWTTSWMLAAKSDYRRIVATSQDGRILLVDFGIYKGAPNYTSRDGNVIENLDLLRGTDHTTEIVWRNPVWPKKTSSQRH